MRTNKEGIYAVACCIFAIIALFCNAKCLCNIEEASDECAILGIFCMVAAIFCGIAVWAIKENEYNN